MHVLPGILLSHLMPFTPLNPKTSQNSAPGRYRTMIAKSPHRPTHEIIQSVSNWPKQQNVNDFRLLQCWLLRTTFLPIVFLERRRGSWCRSTVTHHKTDTSTEHRSTSVPSAADFRRKYLCCSCDIRPSFVRRSTSTAPRSLPSIRRRSS